MTTKQEIRNMGFDRGRNIASWVDLPEIGQVIPKDIDWVGYCDVSKENQYDVWVMYCNESESLDRQNSPFEFTAHDLNEIADSKPYDPWDVFESGIAAGISAYGRKHHAEAMHNAKATI